MSYDFSSSKPADSNMSESEEAQRIQAVKMALEIQREIQKATIRMTDLCYTTCVDKPKEKLDSRSETCVQNCMDRYQDTAQLVLERFAQNAQQGS